MEVKTERGDKERERKMVHVCVLFPPTAVARLRMEARGRIKQARGFACKSSPTPLEALVLRRDRWMT